MTGKDFIITINSTDENMTPDEVEAYSDIATGNIVNFTVY